MTATWTLLSAPRVNREGNQIELEFSVADLVFTPKYSQSDIRIPSSDLPNDYGPLVGWRANETAFRQFLQIPNAPVTDEPKLFSATIYSISKSGTVGTIKAALRLVKRAQISSGADLRPDSSLPATWIIQLPSGFALLKDGGDSTSSREFKFSDGWDGLDLSEAAENVGKLPGWNGASGTPTLRLQCDSFAERARRAPDGTGIDTAIDGWADLRSTSPNDLTQTLPAGQPVLFANTPTPPELRFNKSESKGSLLGHTADYDLVQSGCAFGVVFRAEAGTTTATQHLIGRWSASPPTDNASTRQWRLIYERTAGAPPTHKIKVQFVGPGSSFTVNTLEATIDAPTAKTIVVYRASESSPTTGELWVNGVLVASTTTLHTSTNTGANTRLTVGGRYTAIVDADNPASNPLIGTMDQCFVYSSAISDATLSAVHHELARRAATSDALGEDPRAAASPPPEGRSLVERGARPRLVSRALSSPATHAADAPDPQLSPISYLSRPTALPIPVPTGTDRRMSVTRPPCACIAAATSYIPRHGRSKQPRPTRRPIPLSSRDRARSHLAHAAMGAHPRPRHPQGQSPPPASRRAPQHPLRHARRLHQSPRGPGRDRRLRASHQPPRPPPRPDRASHLAPQAPRCAGESRADSNRPRPRCRSAHAPSPRRAHPPHRNHHRPGSPLPGSEGRPGSQGRARAQGRAHDKASPGGNLGFPIAHRSRARSLAHRPEPGARLQRVRARAASSRRARAPRQGGTGARAAIRHRSAQRPLHNFFAARAHG